MSISSLNKKISKIEHKRTMLALQNNTEDFIHTYNIPSQNFNTGKYWNNKFKSLESLEEQDEMTREKIKKIASFIPNNIRLLDLGIGQGYLEQFLKKSRRKIKLYGIDISPVSIKRMQKMFKGRFITDNILKIEKHYQKNYFDVIVAIEVIEHISPKEIFYLYRKIYSLLKPKGLLIISTPLNEGLSSMNENPSAHVREYTIPILKKELEIENFEIINMKTHYAFRSLYIFKKLLAKFIKRWEPNNIVIVAKKK